MRRVEGEENPFAGYVMQSTARAISIPTRVRRDKNLHNSLNLMIAV